MVISHVGGSGVAPALITSSRPAGVLRLRKVAAPIFLFVGSLAAVALVPSQAAAQVQPGCTSTLPAPYNPFTQIIGGVVGAASSITSVIGTMNTAFQAQGD